MENSDRSRRTAAEDLALVGQVQDHLDRPRGFAVAYDVLFSVVCGVLVGAQGLPLAFRPLATIVVVLSLAGLMLWWRRRLGWWPRTYSSRARGLSCAMLALILGLVSWVWAVPVLWVTLTAGVAAAVVAFVAGRLWARVWTWERDAARVVS